jgi:hypothetical protein
MGRSVVLVARRGLEEGDEITDCYGFHYTALQLSERRRRIKRYTTVFIIYYMSCKATELHEVLALFSAHHDPFYGETNELILLAYTENRYKNILY